MTSKQCLFLLVACMGVCLHTALGQLDVMNNFSNHMVSQGEAHAEEDPGTVDVVADNEDEDDDDDDVLSRLGQVDTVEDFVSLLYINGRRVTNDDLYDNLVDEDGKQVISGGGRMAMPDSCSPRNTTIRITMGETDSDVTFFPRCTKIERCGGCCTDLNLECRPKYTEGVRIKVLTGRIPFPGAPHLDYAGFAPVVVDRHVACHVVCTLTQDKCGPKKFLNRAKCMCKCRRQLSCPVSMQWDPEDCSCKCQQQSNRNCVLVMNPDTSTCECPEEVEMSNYDGRRTISAGGSSSNRSQSESSQTGSSDQAAPDATSSQPTPATTTTGTTTASTTITTSTTEAFDPCLTINCPRRFVKHRRGNTCSCRPSMLSFGRMRPFNRG